MKLSKKTQAELQTFFRHYFKDETLKLPKVEVYARRGSNLLTRLIGVDGITIGRHIFVRSRRTNHDKENNLTISKNLLAHELAHVLQYQKLGFFVFLFDYLREYLAGLKRKKKLNATARMHSYFEISHEVEARDAANKFEEWVTRKSLQA